MYRKCLVKIWALNNEQKSNYKLILQVIRAVDSKCQVEQYRILEFIIRSFNNKLLKRIKL